MERGMEVLLAKYQERIKARTLRKNGWSLKRIAKRLKVSKSSVSLWCREIKLTQEQLFKLEESRRKGGWKGRLKGAEVQKRRRLTEIEGLRNKGIKEVGKLTEKEFFTAGLGLYLGEGTKNPDTEVSLRNSDSKVILFMLDWFQKFCQVSKDEFVCHIIINEAHKNRQKEIENYWSRITHLPLSQFSKTTLSKTKNKKVYDNFNEYFGAVRLKVRSSRRIQRKILGCMEGLFIAAV